MVSVVAMLIMLNCPLTPGFNSHESDAECIRQQIACVQHSLTARVVAPPTYEERVEFIKSFCAKGLHEQTK